MDDLVQLIQRSILGKGNKLNEEDLLLVEDTDMLISHLFAIVKKIIDKYPSCEELYNINYVFDYLEILIKNKKDVDINQVQSKIKKQINSINRSINKNFKNKKKSLKELNDVIKSLSSLNKLLVKKDNFEYDFIDSLIRKQISIDYIEFVFDKIPHVLKAKDDLGFSLFQNTVNSYLDSLDLEDEVAELYYKKLIEIILDDKNYYLNSTDKKSSLEAIYQRLSRKNSKDKVRKLKDLTKIIKEEKSYNMSFDKIASSYNIDIFFDEDYFDELEKCSDDINISDYKDRTYIDDYIITIDGARTSEIDDALSCRKLDNGNYLLGVHIASVLGYFDYYSDIVQNAFNRGSAIYLSPDIYKDTIIPIFPLSFSENYASLVEGKNRLARSYIFEIDKMGNIVNEKFIKSIINNNKRTTYDEVENLFTYGYKDKRLMDTINNLKEVTSILKNRYQSNEFYEFIKENSIDASSLRVRQVNSESMVYYSILLTGNRVAEYFSNNKYPCLYRVHSVSSDINTEIEYLIKSCSKGELFSLIEGVYPRSTYALNGRHEGLDLDNYCHCTSPLRRASDILLEHALEVCHDRKPTENDLICLEEEINNKYKFINQKQQLIEWFVEDINKQYRLKKDLGFSR